MPVSGGSFSEASNETGVGMRLLRVGKTTAPEIAGVFIAASAASTSERTLGASCIFSRRISDAWGVAYAPMLAVEAALESPGRAHRMPRRCCGLRERDALGAVADRRHARRSL